MGESVRDVEFVADYCRARGFDVQVPETRLRRSADELKACANDGDLFVSKAGEGDWRTVEVKRWLGRNGQFTGTHDMRFPHSVLVDNSPRHEKPRRYPLWGYFILNEARTVGLWVHAYTKPYWRVEGPKWIAGRWQDIVVCPTEYVQAHRLDAVRGAG